MNRDAAAWGLPKGTFVCLPGCSRRAALLLFAKVKEVLAERQTEQIIVGMPRNMDGSIGPQALKVQDFVAVLKKSVAVPIQTWDERLTSVMAEEKLREAGINAREAKKKVDASAAAVMLQDYMDSISE